MPKHPASKPCRRNLYSKALLCLAACSLIASLAQAGGGKPIGLTGNSFGSYDVTSIIRNILDHEDWHFETRGRLMPVEDFADYSIVVIAHSQQQRYSLEEHAAVKRYLENGGRILLLSHAPRLLVDRETLPAAREWLGFDGQSIRPIEPAEAIIADDPIFTGVIVDGAPPPSWIAGSYGAINIEPDVEVLIGGDNRAMVLRRKVGDGVLYYLAHELFRLRPESSPHNDDSDAYVELIRNILAEANPMTYRDWFNRQARDWHDRGQRFLVWNREWQNGTESGPVFIPPLPELDESVDNLSVDLALGEYETLQLNFTDLGAGGLLQWDIDLAGMPEGALTVYVQDKPEPIPWPRNPEIAYESPYWLMPAEVLEPGIPDAVAIAAGETRILWLKFSSHQMEAGHYPAAIHFSVDDTFAATVNLNVRVYPVRLPERRLITLNPLGHVYGDVNNVEPAMRFKRNLRDNGFEWTLINVLRPQTFTINGETLTPQLITKHLDDIFSASAPAIDFSSLDPYIDASIAHNLTYIRATSSVTESINVLTRNLDLTDGEKAEVRNWYLEQFARYLKDKGIRNFYAALGDEMNADALRGRFIPWSETLAEAGWTSTSNFTTSAVAERELTDKLAPLVGAWTLNRLHVPLFMEWVRSGELELPPGTLVGSYGAGEGRGTEIRKNARESRMIGWEAWALGTDYCAPNPYFKGWLYYWDFSTADRRAGGERFVAYLDVDDLEAPLLNSPFLEGIRESMEEANLAAIMSWYLDRLGDRAPDELIERAGTLVGDDDTAILQWQTRTFSTYESLNLDASRAEYNRAKREVLEILNELRGPVAEAGIQPGVFWHDIELVRDGRPVAAVVTSTDMTELNHAMQRLGGMPLPVVSGEPEWAETVIYAAAVGSPQAPQSLRQELGPHPEDYSWIRDTTDPATGRTIIWIGGTDARQLNKALGRFNAFLRQEGGWLD